MMIINVYGSHWLSGTSAVVVGCQAVRSRVLLGSWVFKFLCPGPCPCGGSGCLPFFLKAVPSPFLRPGWRGSRQRVTPWGGQEPTDELPYSTRPGFRLNESSGLRFHQAFIDHFHRSCAYFLAQDDSYRYRGGCGRWV